MLGPFHVSIISCLVSSNTYNIERECVKVAKPRKVFKKPRDWRKENPRPSLWEVMRSPEGRSSLWTGYKKTVYVRLKPYCVHMTSFCVPNDCDVIPSVALLHKRHRKAEINFLKKQQIWTNLRFYLRFWGCWGPNWLSRYPAWKRFWGDNGDFKSS